MAFSLLSLDAVFTILGNAQRTEELDCPADPKRMAVLE
jgi:hypothetical protein